MTIPKYCGSNDPLLSYTTRLHPLEDHTTARLPINSVSFCDNLSEDTKDIKTEIKTEPGEVSSVKLGKLIVQFIITKFRKSYFLLLLSKNGSHYFF